MDPSCVWASHIPLLPTEAHSKAVEKKKVDEPSSSALFSFHIHFIHVPSVFKNKTDPKLRFSASLLIRNDIFFFILNKLIMEICSVSLDLNVSVVKQSPALTLKSHLVFTRATRLFFFFINGK